jgi:hypothetical protein
MLRLREIEQRIEAHAEQLRRRGKLAEECEATRALSTAVARCRERAFDEVNDLIDRHNRWYRRSPATMDPRRGDYALVNGRDYHLPPLDADWVLERYPQSLAFAATS